MNQQKVSPLVIFSVLVLLVARLASGQEISKMSFQAQQQSNWCWAASTSVVGQRNGIGRIPQCQMASRFIANTSDSNYCCNPANAQSHYCNKGYIPEETLRIYGILDRKSSTPISQSEIVKEVQGGYPLIITVMWSGGGGHAVTIYGASSYATTGGQIETINIFDSAGQGDKVVMARRQAEYYSGGRWTRTMTSKCPNNNCT